MKLNIDTVRRDATMLNVQFSDVATIGELCKYLNEYDNEAKVNIEYDSKINSNTKLSDIGIKDGDTIYFEREEERAKMMVKRKK